MDCWSVVTLDKIFPISVFLSSQVQACEVWVLDHNPVFILNTSPRKRQRTGRAQGPGKSGDSLFGRTHVASIFLIWVIHGIMLVIQGPFQVGYSALLSMIQIVSLDWDKGDLHIQGESFGQSNDEPLWTVRPVATWKRNAKGILPTAGFGVW